LLEICLEVGNSVPMSETNDRALEKKLNWLRAAVLGANDGIVSVGWNGHGGCGCRS
jgi:hypothetical protein